jgi:hypothetical protein
LIRSLESDPVGEDTTCPLDFSELDEHDDAYLRAVSDHLGWLPAMVTAKRYFGLTVVCADAALEL